MNEEQQKKLLDLIQRSLEQFKDNGEDLLFFTSMGNRGLISGTYEGLAALMLYNMVAYPQFRAIIEIAVRSYPKLSQDIEKLVKENRPPYEIVDNYGLEIEKIMSSMFPNTDGDEKDKG